MRKAFKLIRSIENHSQEQLQELSAYYVICECVNSYCDKKITDQIFNYLKNVNSIVPKSKPNKISLRDCEQFYLVVIGYENSENVLIRLYDDRFEIVRNEKTIQIFFEEF